MKWNPADHPRGALGRFIEVLDSLSPGQEVELPNGTRVRKKGSGESRLKGRFHVADTTRTPNTDHHGVRDAAERALKRDKRAKVQERRRAKRAADRSPAGLERKIKKSKPGSTQEGHLLNELSRANRDERTVSGASGPARMVKGPGVRVTKVRRGDEVELTGRRKEGASVLHDWGEPVVEIRHPSGEVRWVRESAVRNERETRNDIDPFKSKDPTRTPPGSGMGSYLGFEGEAIRRVRKNGRRNAEGYINELLSRGSITGPQASELHGRIQMEPGKRSRRKGFESTIDTSARHGPGQVVIKETDAERKARHDLEQGIKSTERSLLDKLTDPSIYTTEALQDKLANPDSDINQGLEPAAIRAELKKRGALVPDAGGLPSPHQLEALRDKPGPGRVGPRPQLMNELEAVASNELDHQLTVFKQGGRLGDLTHAQLRQLSDYLGSELKVAGVLTRTHMVEAGTYSTAAARQIESQAQELLDALIEYGFRPMP